jgi:DNA-directed RNA polymerase III subunit RPC3
MSSTSTEASILCQHIIKNLYGPVVARVATILLDRGRLPFVQICRLLHPIKPQDVRYCLLILIQHHLIWHFNDAPPASAETDEKPPPGQDFFEPNPAEILHRLHFGAYIGIAEEIDIPSRPSLKGISAMIIFELLKHGRRRIKDLIDDVVNLEECKATFEEVRDTVTFLAGHRYVEASTPLQSSYPLDRYNAIRKEKLAGLTTAAASSKAKKDAERAAREEFIEERASDLKDANERMYADSYVGPADAKPEERKVSDQVLLFAGS